MNLYIDNSGNQYKLLNTYTNPFDNQLWCELENLLDGLIYNIPFVIFKKMEEI